MGGCFGGMWCQRETGGGRWCTATGFRDQAQRVSELCGQERTRRALQAAGVPGQQRVRDGAMEKGRVRSAQSGRKKKKEDDRN